MTAEHVTANATEQVTLSTGSSAIPAPAGHEQVQLTVSYPRTDAVLVTVTGAIDEATVARVEHTLWPRLSAQVATIVVDLSGVDFLGVPGLQLLSQAQMRTDASGIDLRVVATTHEVVHSLHVGGLGTLLDYHTSAPEALRTA